jgi:hypothetical protein
LFAAPAAPEHHLDFRLFFFLLGLLNCDKSIVCPVNFVPGFDMRCSLGASSLLETASTLGSTFLTTSFADSLFATTGLTVLLLKSVSRTG